LPREATDQLVGLNSHAYDCISVLFVASSHEDEVMLLIVILLYWMAEAVSFSSIIEENLLEKAIVLDG
jgi:hypothetical protein